MATAPAAETLLVLRRAVIAAIAIEQRDFAVQIDGGDLRRDARCRRRPRRRRRDRRPSLRRPRTPATSPRRRRWRRTTASRRRGAGTGTTPCARRVRPAFCMRDRRTRPLVVPARCRRACCRTPRARSASRGSRWGRSVSAGCYCCSRSPSRSLHQSCCASRVESTPSAWSSASARIGQWKRNPASDGARRNDRSAGQHRVGHLADARGATARPASATAPGDGARGRARRPARPASSGSGERDVERGRRARRDRRRRRGADARRRAPPTTAARRRRRGWRRAPSLNGGSIFAARRRRATRRCRCADGRRGCRRRARRSAAASHSTQSSARKSSPAGARSSTMLAARAVPADRRRAHEEARLARRSRRACAPTAPSTRRGCRAARACAPRVQRPSPTLAPDEVHHRVDAVEARAVDGAVCRIPRDLVSPGGALDLAPHAIAVTASDPTHEPIKPDAPDTAI